VRESPSTPQINASKMPVGGGVAGALVVISTMLIFLVGIPAMRYFLIGAIVLGCAVAGIIHFSRRFFPPKPPQTLSLTEHCPAAGGRSLAAASWYRRIHPAASALRPAG